MPPHFVLEWVGKNIAEAFLPVSKATAAGVIRRGVQLQGWTIEGWLKCGDPVRSLAIETIDNLKKGIERGYVEIGFSAYSHPILPLLYEDLIKLQVMLDYEVINEHFGEPLWFWPPEGGVDRRLLAILFEVDPDMVVIIPDRSLGKTNFSGVMKIKHADEGVQKVLVCNTLLKDMMMNAAYYQNKPDYFQFGIDWHIVQEMNFDGEKFDRVLDVMCGDTDMHILARDWENKGSRDSLHPIEGKGMDVKGMLESKVEYKLISEINWDAAEIIDITRVLPNTWDSTSNPSNPYPYWSPREEMVVKLDSESREWVFRWNALVKEYNELVSKWIDSNEGIMAVLADAVKKDVARRFLPGLMSCIPWHFLMEKELGADPGFSKKAWENIVVPAKKELEKLL